MQVKQFTFSNYFVSFYQDYIPFMMFILCYLLFKNKPTKIAYIHLFIVIFGVSFKHWATLLNTLEHGRETFSGLDETAIIIKYYLQSGFTALLAVLLLSLLHRPHNISYDALLKKEIWGIWHKENNTSDYFDARERKLNAQGAKDNEQ